MMSSAFAMVPEKARLQIVAWLGALASLAFLIRFQGLCEPVFSYEGVAVVAVLVLWMLARLGGSSRSKYLLCSALGSAFTILTMTGVLRWF